MAICPASGPGKLSKLEISSRALEIMAEHGANSIERFRRVEAIETGASFGQQADRWISACQHRKRNPVAPATLESWRSTLEKWLIPNLGDTPLSSVNNAILKTLVQTLVDAGLSPKSISNYAAIVKMVVASAVDENGDEIHPRKWNADFIDAPIVDKGRQHTPSFTSEQMFRLVRAAEKDWERMLYVLCGSTGIRIGEALGLSVENVSADGSTVLIQQKVRKCKIESGLKTKNAEREIDLPTSVAVMLRNFIGDRTTGLLFQTRNGGAMSDSNIRTRFLHVRCAQLGLPKVSPHGFRRYRTTWLRSQAAPEDLIRFWLGHENKSVTDGYSKLRDHVAFRKEVAERIGIGFELPKTGEVVPNVPSLEVENVA